MRFMITDGPEEYAFPIFHQLGHPMAARFGLRGLRGFWGQKKLFKEAFKA